jgi:hypothetical protein
MKPASSSSLAFAGVVPSEEEGAEEAEEAAAAADLLSRVAIWTCLPEMVMPVTVAPSVRAR